jgi:prepilin-type N-terminal cleavage/methylation domain-containing protein
MTRGDATSRQIPCRGFTLLELAIVLLVIAVVTGMAAVSGISVLATARLTSTQLKMKTIDEVLMKYRIATGRLPCPGDLTLAPGASSYGVEAANPGSCTGGTPSANFTGKGVTNTSATGAEGAVPAVTLGLSPDMMLDGWGNKFRYAVDISMTATGAFASVNIGCTNGAITVNDASGNPRTTAAIYALVSSGASAHGAFGKGSAVTNTGSVNTNELTNCHCTSAVATTTYAPTYVQSQPTLDPTNPLNGFDDLVSYRERWQLRADWDKGGRCTYVYVADTWNNRVQIYNPNGTWLGSLGGTSSSCTSCLCTGSSCPNSSGSGNGQLFNATAVALDSYGNIWVDDEGNGRLVEFSSTGTYLNKIDSTVIDGNWMGMYGVAIDSGNNLWVFDYSGCRVVEYSTSGTVLTKIGTGYQGAGGTIGTPGNGNGQFGSSIGGIAIDSSNNVWVLDNANNRIEKFSSSGAFLLGIGSGYQGAGGSIGAAGSGSGQLNGAWGIAVDSSGNVWVNDFGNERVQEFSSTGAYLNQFYAWGLSNPAVDSSGNIWASSNTASYGSGDLQFCSGVRKYSGNGTLLACYGSGDGSGNGQFDGAGGIAIGSR